MYCNNILFSFFIMMSYNIGCTTYGATIRPLQSNSNKEDLETASNSFFTKFGNFLQDEMGIGTRNDGGAAKYNKKRDLFEDEGTIDTITNQDENEINAKTISNGQAEKSSDEKASNNDNGNIPLLQNDNNKESSSLPLLGGKIPQIPAGNSDGNKEQGGGLPFPPGGNFQLPGGLGDLTQGVSQTPKLVWGGFFFVETPVPGASMSNISNMASLMQNGQQMVPGGLPIPGAG